MTTPFTTISPAEAEKLAAENPMAMWLDVRTPAEYFQLGHVPGARLIPHMAITNYIDDIRDHNGPILVVCEHGIRSQYAARILAMAGVPNVFNVAGGMSMWHGPRSYTDDEAGTDDAGDSTDE